MNFDINKVLHDMVGAINESVKDSAGEIKNYAEEILQNEKRSLLELGQARISGQIDNRVFEREIEREKKVVKAELLTIEIMSKAMAEKAVNAAIEVFVTAVKAAI